MCDQIKAENWDKNSGLCAQFSGNLLIAIITNYYGDIA